jgi:hypothetical protein
MTHHVCPICEKSDAVRVKDDPRFYKDGRLTAICFHGHGNGKPVVFDAETGAAIKHTPLEPFESLYRVLESGPARGMGPAFLAERCGIYRVTKAAIQAVKVPFPTEKDLIEAENEGAAIMAAPLYDGPAMVGLELRKLEVTSAKVTRWFKVLGSQGVYIANPAIQPKAICAFEGVWDAVAAAWDAHNNDSENYAFTAFKAGTSAHLIRKTHEAHFPGIPALIITDQDAAGKGARQRLKRAGTIAILPGTGMAKDYREAEPKSRWDALLDSIERALDAGNPTHQEEDGIWKIARRAFDGATEAKLGGMRDLEAWRFGQRCAGICKAPTGGKKYYSIRARVYGRAPVAEGLHEFEPLLSHSAFIRIGQNLPSLASIIQGGPTESPMSPEWVPPSFLGDGRHWTEIPKDDRVAYAREHGWEPWTGKEVGTVLPIDLPTFISKMRSAYLYVRIPGSADSEVGYRVSAFCLAGALTALWAEERWHSGKPLGFLPILWFFGGPNSGKGTATKIMSMLVSGDPKTHGSQRFDGQQGGWLTESVLHGPICFRDELDQFLTDVELEDMKAYTSGEPLQLRKKFGTDMTIAPRPVVFSSNSLKVNQDDEATKERIVLIQLDPNPVFTKTDRNAAFDTFFRWVENEGGLELMHRVCIGLYRQFRLLPMGKPKWTRSVSFDAAMEFVCKILDVQPSYVMDLAQESKEEAIQQVARWYRNTKDYLTHEIALGEVKVGTEFAVKASEVWGIQILDENQVRKFRMWLDQFEQATKNTALIISGFQVSLGPKTKSTQRMIIFKHTGVLGVAV